MWKLWRYAHLPTQASGVSLLLTVNANGQGLESEDVATLPTFKLFRGGYEVARVEGLPQKRPARKLAMAVRQHLLVEPGVG